MTDNVKVFVEKLSQLNMKWFHLGVSLTIIRTRVNGCLTCPVVAVAGGYGEGYKHWYEKVGLTSQEAHSIVISEQYGKNAPQGQGCYDPELRAAILKACNLEEIPDGVESSDHQVRTAEQEPDQG